MKLLFIPLIIVLALSCGQEVKKENAESRELSKETTPFPVSDTLDIVYYKKPYKDPERYTRFFNLARVADSSLITPVRQILLLPGVKQDSVRKCMSEGKMVMQLKGDAYRTIYFARAVGECSYLYVIRDGAFYYYEMPEAVKAKLDQYETSAREPEASAASAQ